MTKPRRLPPPPPVPAEAREVALTVPPPGRPWELCKTCGEHEATHVWDFLPGGTRRGYTRCADCARVWREVCREVDAEMKRQSYRPDFGDPGPDYEADER